MKYEIETEWRKLQ